MVKFSVDSLLALTIFILGDFYLGNYQFILGDFYLGNYEFILGDLGNYQFIFFLFYFCW